MGSDEVICLLEVSPRQRPFHSSFATLVIACRQCVYTIIKISPPWEIVKVALRERLIWLVMVMGFLVVKELVSERMT